MPNNDDEDKLLMYLKSLDSLRKEDSQYIRSLLEVFNFGRAPKDKKPHHFQELAVFMLDESNFNRVMHHAEKLLPPKTFATFKVNMGVAQEEALVKEYMHSLPDDSIFPLTSTIADLVRYFGRAELHRYFVVAQEGVGELAGIVSITDYSPNQEEIESMPPETAVTKLHYFHRQIETIRDIDTMDLAQQEFEIHPKRHYLFVVNETRHPIGLLSKEEDLKRWKADKQG